MANGPYNPVRRDSKKTIAEASSRPGFSEARDALEAAYAALSALLKARQKAGPLLSKLLRSRWDR